MFSRFFYSSFFAISLFSLQTLHGTELFNNTQWSVKLESEVLNGEGLETLYWTDYDGRKVSELNWDLQDIYMGGISVEGKPRDDWKVKLRALTNLNKESGIMVDSDWTSVNPSLKTHRTESLLDLKRAIDFEALVSYTFFEDDRISFDATVGYQYLNFDWEAFGATGLYSTVSLFDTFVSISPSIPVIRYQQSYHIPFLGLGMQVPFNDQWKLTSCWKFSPLVYGYNKDEHLLRDIETTSHPIGDWYSKFDLGVHYQIDDQYSASFVFAHKYIHEMRGDLQWRELTPSGTSVSTLNNADGMGLHTTSLALELGIRF